jgi:DNA (cytosine-5)-methyltransferase 1
MNYYNEFDPHAAAWLRELISENLIPQGHVDTRSITEVSPSDLSGFTQCHFFAGIAGWPLALALAHWPAGRPVWTGSCPCQPLSCAGQQKGHADERHLWPAFYRLIAECRPPTVFGEQVAGGDGREWLSGVRADLEGVGYAVGAADLCAAGVGAPHIRQRLYWVANAAGERRAGKPVLLRAKTGGRDSVDLPEAPGGSGAGWVEHSPGDGREQRWSEPSGRGAASGCESGGMGEARSDEPENPSSHGGVANADVLVRHRAGSGASPDGRQLVREEGVRGFWDHSILLPCRDGKARRVPRPESIFQLESDGIFGTLGSRWNFGDGEIAKEILTHAKKTEADPGEILLSVWREVRASSLRGESGGHDPIPFQEILLVALCQLARSQRAVFHTATQDLREICQETLRTVWIVGSSPRPPQEQELEGPPDREPGNPVHSVPSGKGTPQAQGEVRNLRDGLPSESDVPGALSAVEKVWRRLADQGSVRRDLSACASAIVASASFPLTGKLSGRVGLLLGAGNAIVPPLAATFIRAFLT